jgi:hypothetical protein
MRKKRLRQRDLLDWLGAIADVVQITALLAGSIGLLYWYVSTRSGLTAVIVALSVAMVAVLGIVVWLAVKTLRAKS